jgi:hypothetical protein
MSLSTRKELLASFQKRYNKATWNEKGKILDELRSGRDSGQKGSHL